MMPRRKRIRGLCLALFALTTGLSACGGQVGKKIEDAIPGRQADYKSSRSVPRLEVPPDLAKPAGNEAMVVPEIEPAGGATYSEYASAAQTRAVTQTQVVLPQLTDIRVARSGDKRWLVIKATPGQVWPKAKEFWLESGFILKTEDPAIGIMETDWAENRADIPRDWIRSLLEKVTTALYSAATRDKFRTRLERGTNPDTTELFISHRGAEEVTQGDSFVWQPRPSDPELEAEMLNRMMVYLGICAT